MSVCSPVNLSRPPSPSSTASAPRAIDTEISLFGHSEEPEIQEGDTTLDDLTHPDDAGPIPTPNIQGLRKASRDITQGDFLAKALTYKGKPFNVVHCDFPYGIDHDKSAQGGTAGKLTYEDSLTTYTALVETLITNADRLMTPNAHILFWLSMNQYLWTCETFARARELHGQPVPSRMVQGGQHRDAPRSPSRSSEGLRNGPADHPRGPANR